VVGATAPALGATSDREQVLKRRHRGGCRGEVTDPSAARLPL
jgi:hypothetical protein